MNTTPEIERLRSELASHKALRPADPHSKQFQRWLDRKDHLASELQRAVYAEESRWHQVRPNGAI